MDDNSIQGAGEQSTASPPPENVQPESTQPVTIFETVPEETPPDMQPESLQPEEVAPDVATPEEAASAPPPPPPEEPPMVFEENKSKFLFIGGGIVFFIIMFIVIIKALTGPKPPPAKVNLVYWGLWEEKEIMAPIIAQYQARNKHITVDYQKMSPQSYREKLLARSKDGQGPDIFRFHNTWLPEIRDVVAPLPSSIMPNAEFEQTFYPIHQTDLKVGEYYYGLPLMIDGLVLIYNDGLLKRAGITTGPTNWDEVVDYATKLSVKDKDGQLVTAGIALGTASNVEHYSDIFGLFLLQNGGDLKNLKGEGAVGALESYRKFAEDPQNSYWTEYMPNSITAFTQEKVAMIIAPSWQVLTIKNINPDLEVKVAPVPSVPGGKPLSLATYWAEGVSRYSKNQLEAWKFLKYLTEKDTMTKLYETQAKVRLFGEPYSRVDLAPALAQNEYIGPVIQEAKYFVSLPLSSRTHDNGLNDDIITYIGNAINATAQGTFYQNALQTAQDGVNQVFTRYKIQ